MAFFNWFKITGWPFKVTGTPPFQDTSEGVSGKDVRNARMVRNSERLNRLAQSLDKLADKGQSDTPQYKTLMDEYIRRGGKF